MQASTIKQALKVGAKVAQAGIEAERLKDRATHAVEDTVIVAKRAAKNGRYIVEDWVDEATYCIKRHPLQAVGFTLGAGLTLGAICGLALSRLKFTTRCGDTQSIA